LNEGAIRQGDFTIVRAGATPVNATRPERRWVDRYGKAACGGPRKRSMCPSAAKAGLVLMTCARAEARCGEVARTLLGLKPVTPPKNVPQGPKGLIRPTSDGTAEAVPFVLTFRSL